MCAGNINKIRVTMASFSDEAFIYMVRVLFVCMGNICRSPTAEGVFRSLVNKAGLSDRIHIDSAGTHAYHVGEPPDQRAQAAARKRNIDLSSQRARKVRVEDFDEYDYILAMDQNNVAELEFLVSNKSNGKLKLFLEYAEKASTLEVPDPYYGGPHGFEHVLDLVEAASTGLLNTIKEQHKL